jgi:O-antigen ligase/tetratricopeptide (TPR) repeat protein
MHTIMINSLALLLMTIPFAASMNLTDEWLHLGAENLKLIVGLIGSLFLSFLWFAKSYKDKAIIVQKNRLYLPIFLLLVWNYISLFWTTNNYPAFIVLAQFTSIAILFFLVVNIIKNSLNTIRLLKVVSFGLLGVSVIGLLQYYFNDVVVIKDFFWQSGKPSSTFGNKNMASHFVVMTLPISVGLFIYAKNKKSIGLYAFIFAIGSWFLMYASARQAYLASIVQLSLFLLFLSLDYIKNREKSILSSLLLKRFKIVIGIISVLFLIVISNLTDKGWNVSDLQHSKIERVGNIVDTKNERIPGWLNTIEMIKDNPIVGVGAGQWRGTYSLYVDKVMQDEFILDYSRSKRLHNDYLEMLANVGIVGFIFLLWILMVSIKIIFSVLTDVSNKYRALVLSISIGLFGFLIVAMVSFPIEVYLPIFLVFLYIAFINSFDTEKDCYKFLFNRKYFLSFLLFFLILVAFIGKKSVDWLYAEGYYTASTISESKGKFDLAMQDSYKAFLLNQENPRYSLSVGRNLLKTNKPMKSIKFLKHGWSLSPLDKGAMLDLSMAYKRTNQSKFEKNVLIQLLNKYPDDVNALARVSQVFFTDNQKIKAKKSYIKMKINFDRVKDRKGFYPSHKDVAKAANMFKDYQYVSYVYTSMINKDWYVDSAQDYAVLATIEYFRLGNEVKGIALYKQALRLDPNVKIPSIIFEKLNKI